MGELLPDPQLSKNYGIKTPRFARKTTQELLVSEKSILKSILKDPTISCQITTFSP